MEDCHSAMLQHHTTLQVRQVVGRTMIFTNTFPGESRLEIWVEMKMTKSNDMIPYYSHREKIDK
jgi:hypothetical protein